jgi:hypothetical protein
MWDSLWTEGVTECEDRRSPEEENEPKQELTFSSLVASSSITFELD